MKYAITYKDNGIEEPEYIYNEEEAAKNWFKRHHGNTSSLDMIILAEDETPRFAGFDGGYFLNLEP